MSRFTNDSSSVGRLFAASVIAALVFALPVSATLAAPPAEALTLVVMDPLAKPLSCPCVQGYAQRDYELLAARLERDLKRPITIVFNESLQAALDGDAKGRADIVVGKHSVVLYDAARAKLALTPILALSNKGGGTTMTGLVVVPTADPAQSISELNGVRLVFGPAECDEKHTAALALFKQNGVTPPATLETAVACDEGALKILDDAKQGRRGAAVISSYAQPLLEGCGTVAKGALRVVGETTPVPFIEVYVRSELPQAERDQIAAVLKKSTTDPQLRIALETRDGFVPIPADLKKK